MSQGAADNCRVVVRVKPLAEDDEQCLVWQTISASDPIPRRLIFPDMDRAYVFDAIIPPEATQRDTYQTACTNMFDSFLQGFNCCLFAYGQTGAGKSFTMGTVQTRKEDRGIVPRGLLDFFTAVNTKRDSGWDVQVSVTYIEIYNEEIRDLLNPENAPVKLKTPSIGTPPVLGGTGLFGAQSVSASRPNTAPIGIKITQDAQTNQIQVIGVKVVPVSSESEALECLNAGALYRSTGSNKLNLTSSRSHAIFTLTVEQTEVLSRRDFETGSSKIVSKFHFVDLAGSERVKRTQAAGSRLREGININSGLLALSNVINALTEETQTVSHVPYRDSKLTRLLQDSLGGNSKTVMIACVSAGRQDFAETFSTIKYATRARNIKNTPIVNKDPQKVLIESLRKRLDELTTELEAYKSSCVIPSPHEPGKKDVSKEVIADLEREIADLKSVICDREQREAEERAKRIALEAKLLKYRARYKSLIKDLKSQIAVSPEFGSKEDADDSNLDSDEETTENLSSTEEALVRTSELELTCERLRQELQMLQQAHESQTRLAVAAVAAETRAEDEEDIGRRESRESLMKQFFETIKRLANEQGILAHQDSSSDLSVTGPHAEDVSKTQLLVPPAATGDDVSVTSEFPSLHKYVTAASGDDFESYLQRSEQREARTETKEGQQKDSNARIEQIVEEEETPVHEMNAHWSTKLNHSIKEELNLDESQIARLLFSASEEDQSALFCLVETLSGESAINESLKSRSEKLTLTIKRTADLLNGMELEKRHWEKVVSDLSMQIQDLQRQLEASEAQKSHLRAKIDALDEQETSEGVTLTPMGEGVMSEVSDNETKAARTPEQAETVRLYKRLEHQTEQSQHRQGRLNILKSELEEVHRRKEASKTQIKLFEVNLQQLKVEKQLVMKRILEQERKHKQMLAEKDRFISKLERDAKRADEELRNERADNQEKMTKIASLQRRNDELKKKIQSLEAVPQGGGSLTRSTVGQQVSSFARPTVVSQNRPTDFAGPENTAVLSRASGGGSTSERGTQRLFQKSSSAVGAPPRSDAAVKRFGGQVVHQSDPALAKRLLSRGAEAKMIQAKQEEQMARKVKKLAKLDAMIEKVQGHVQILENAPGDRDSRARELTEVTDRLDALRSERAMCKSEAEKLQNQRTMKSKTVSELRASVRTNPETFLEAYLDMYAEALGKTDKLQKEVSRKSREVSDLRDLRQRAQAREDALAADYERRKIELLLACNEDKLVFMRSLKNLRSPESGSDMPHLEEQLLREQVHLLMQHKEAADVKIRQLEQPADLSQTVHQPRAGRPSVTVLMSRPPEARRRAFSSTPVSREESAKPSPTRRHESTRLDAARNMSGRSESLRNEPLHVDTFQCGHLRNESIRNERVSSAVKVPSLPLGRKRQLSLTRVSRESSRTCSSARHDQENVKPPPRLPQQKAATQDSEGREREGGRRERGARHRTPTQPPLSSTQEVSPGARVPATRQLSLLTSIADAHGDYITAVSTSSVKSDRMPTQIVTGSHGELRAWDLWRLDSSNPRDSMTFGWEDTRTLQATYSDSSAFIKSIDVLTEKVIVAAVGTTVKIFDLRASEPVHSWLLAPPGDVPPGAAMPVVNSVCVLSHAAFGGSLGHLIAAAGSDRTLRLFDARQRTMLPVCKVPTGDEQLVVSFLPQPNGELSSAESTPSNDARLMAQKVMNGIVSGGENGIVRMWNHGFTHLPSYHNLTRVSAIKGTAVHVQSMSNSGHLCSSPTMSGSPAGMRGLFCCCDRDDRLRLWLWPDELAERLSLKDPTVSAGPAHMMTRHPPVIVGHKDKGGQTDREERDGEEDESNSDNWSSEDEVTQDWQLTERKTNAKSLSALTVLANRDATDVVTGDRRGQLRLWSVEPSAAGDSPLVEETSETHQVMVDSADVSSQFSLRRSAHARGVHTRHRRINQLESFQASRGGHLLFSVGDDTTLKVWHVA